MIIPLQPRRATQASLRGRIALALSILSHRPWCPACAGHARQARQALEGASIDQISQEGA